MMSSQDTISNFCKGKTILGRPCRRRVSSPAEYCAYHVPVRVRLAKVGAGITLLLTLIGLLADLAGLGILRPLTSAPERMNGDFRIAVADFTATDRVTDTNLGHEIAGDIKLKIDQAFQKTSSSVSTTIWGPDKVGDVLGSTISSQTITQTIGMLEAQRVIDSAGKIGADIIVYGVVDEDESSIVVWPRFYVREKSFANAEEITGVHDLGTPIKLSKESNIANRIEMNEDLSSRVAFISQIALGLSYHSRGDFDAARLIFQSLDASLGNSQNLGRKILYILLGNTFLKSDNLDEAETYYRKAVAVQQDYSRGHLGLGVISYARALKLYDKTHNIQDVDSDMLNLARNEFEQASSDKTLHNSPATQTKIDFGLGQIYQMYFLKGESDYAEKALSEYGRVVYEYGDGKIEMVKELAGEAYGQMGLIYEKENYLLKSIAQYKMAISLLSLQNDRRELYSQRVATLEKDLNLFSGKMMASQANHSVPDDVVAEISSYRLVPFFPSPCHMSRLTLDGIDLRFTDDKTALHSNARVTLCNWKENEKVDVLLQTPEGKVIHFNGYSNDRGQIDLRYYIDVNWPVGSYTFTIEGSERTYKHVFVVQPPDNPSVSLEAENVVFLYGFSPDEHVRLFYYEPEGNTSSYGSGEKFKLMGWKDYQVDRNGALLIEVEKGSAYVWFVIGDKSGSFRVWSGNYYTPLTDILKRN